MERSCKELYLMVMTGAEGGKIISEHKNDEDNESCD